MIIYSLNDTEKVYHFHPLFQKAFDYVAKNNMKEHPAGRVDIKGDDVYIMVQDAEGKKKEDAPLEAHHRYIDIQIPLTVEETYGWKAVSDCKEESVAYNQDKDCVFYKDIPTGYVTIQPGQFIIFMPEDGHAPCIGNGEMRKLVVKVKV